MSNKEYKTPEEVKKRAEEAIGHSFKEVFELAQEFREKNNLKERHGKGDIGQAYEEGWFNYACNEEAEPDFKEADIELKVTPFLINSRGYRAKERLSLGKINYRDENWNEYEESRFWTKNHHLLVMYYQYIKSLKRENFSVEKIDEILLEELPERDQMIIRHDWEKIARYVKEGKAHELSERDFMYLSPARKGSGGDEKVKYDDRYPKAKPRAYSFKKSYMTKLFNERMLTSEEVSYILPDIVLPKEKEFDDILIETLKPYLGRTVDSLKKEFPNYRSGYSEKNDIIKQIYKSKGDLEETDEFQKANYRLRTLTVDAKGTPTQDMSFSAFDFEALVKEKTWKDSIVYDEMIYSKILLVIFSKNSEGKEILNNAMIWYIPKKDENKVKEVCKETRSVIKNGIILQQRVSHDRNGRLIFTYKNNFPKSKFNKVAHVRNKAGESEYFGENGNSVKLKKPAEVITLKEIPEELKGVPVPTGEYMTKQCFWFNKKYMKQQIKDYIKTY